MSNQTQKPPIIPPPVAAPPVATIRAFQPAPQPPFARLSDRDLLDGWRRDTNREAFDELVRRYRVMVLSVCRRHCHHDNDADDAFQTTWVCLAQTANQIRHPERLAGWLHRVATRASHLTNQRRRGKNTQTPARGDLEPIEMNELPACDEGAFEALTRRHESIVLDEELAELPNHYRTALVMHLMEGDSYQAIAARLESTVGAVRGHVQRGKQILAARLRRRGIVPVLAYAAIQSLSVSDRVAAEVASQTLPAGLDLSTATPAVCSDPMGSPIQLSSLFQSGNPMLRLSSWTVAASLGTAAIVGLCLAQIPAVGQTTDKPLTVRIAQVPDVDSDASLNIVGQAIVASGQGGGQGQNQKKIKALPDTTAFPAPKPTAEPEFRTEVAREANASLDRDFTLQIKTNSDALADELSEQISAPVIVDHRAVAQAKLSGDQAIDFTSSEEPLRTTLRKTLQPLGLQAVVQDEGIVITADFTELTRQGISTDKWIGMSDELVERLDKALATKVTVNFLETPLNEAVRVLAETADFPILIDKIALEEYGLTEDTPADLSSTDLPLRSALNLMLRPLDLTYTVLDGQIVITSPETADGESLTRLYFLEGTGLPRGDYSTAMTLIQQSIEQDSWEAVGGSGTMAPVSDGTKSRPALLISTTFTVHEQIASLLQSLRETHFGPDPISTTPPMPVSGGGMGGMGGGGMGGMGGGGMGGMGGGGMGGMGGGGMF